MSKKRRIRKEEPNEMGEMFRQMKQRKLALNAKFRTERMNTVFGQIFELQEAGIEVFELTPYQYRLIQQGKRVDYYPTSGKYFDLNKKEWGYCPAQQILTLFQC